MASGGVLNSPLGRKPPHPKTVWGGREKLERKAPPLCRSSQGVRAPVSANRRQEGAPVCDATRRSILRHPARLASTFFFPWKTQFRRVASSSNRRTRRRGSQGAVEIFRRIPTQGIGQEASLIPSSFRY